MTTGTPMTNTHINLHFNLNRQLKITINIPQIKAVVAIEHDKTIVNITQFDQSSDASLSTE